MIACYLLRTTDKSGMESHDFELSTDDRDSAVSLPSRGASLVKWVFIMCTLNPGALVHTAAVLDPSEFASRYHPL